MTQLGLSKKGWRKLRGLLAFRDVHPAQLAEMLDVELKELTQILRGKGEDGADDLLIRICDEFEISYEDHFEEHVVELSPPLPHRLAKQGHKELRTFLRGAGLKMQDLAEKLSVDPSTLSRYLHGKVPIRRKRIEALVAQIETILELEEYTLGVSIEEVLVE